MACRPDVAGFSDFLQCLAMSNQRERSATNLVNPQRCSKAIIDDRM
jgi:hypothetical protein